MRTASLLVLLATTLCSCNSRKQSFEAGYKLGREQGYDQGQYDCYKTVLGILEKKK